MEFKYIVIFVLFLIIISILSWRYLRSESKPRFWAQEQLRGPNGK